MRSLFLLALSIPTVAVADTKIDKYNGGATVELADIVELPLQQGIYGDELPYVKVKFSSEDEDYSLFLIDFGGDKIIVNSTIAEEKGDGVSTHNKAFWKSLGRKKDQAKYKTGGKVETTSIPEMHIGGMVLKDVQARVISVSSTPFSPSEDLNLPSVVSGVIGVGALDIGVSILPSKGLVKFAPADKASTLISEVGTAVPYTPVESQIVKTFVGKEYHPGFAGTVEAKVGEKTAQLSLDTTALAGLMVPSVGVKKGATIVVGDFDLQRMQVGIGELALEEGWFARMGLTFADIEGFHGTIGYDVLRGYDLAFDPAGQIAIAPATSQQREWSVKDFVAKQDREIADLDKPKEGEEAEEPKEGEDDGNAEAKAGLLRDKAVFQIVANDFDGAVKSMEEASTLNPDPCEVWKDLGAIYWRAGYPEKAIEAAQKGLDRYSAWMDLSKEQREEIQEMSDEEQESAGVQIQDLDACAPIAGQLAMYKVAAGEPGAANKLYADHNDYLDPGIALIAGIAKIMEEHPDEAQGPLRQAIKLSAPQYSSTPMIQFYSRVGLAKVFLDKGDKDQAYENWMREPNTLSNDFLALDLLAQIKGEDALKAMQDLAASHPDYPVLQAMLGVEYIKAGQEAKAKNAFEKAQKILENELTFRPQVTANKAYLAYYNYLIGDLAKAEEIATDALKESPDSAYALLTMAYVEAHRYNQEAGKSYLDKAKAVAAPHIMFYYLELPDIKPPRVVVTETAIEIKDKVFFESSKAVILEESFSLLDEVAAIILKHDKIKKISVEGHTDNTGIAKKNKVLSQERAQSVVDYLVSKGVDASRLTAVGYGQEKAIADNNTEEGKALNRRVEFKIVECEK